MGLDKLYARAHMRRIPERVLLGVSGLFGALGGMPGDVGLASQGAQEEVFHRTPLYVFGSGGRCAVGGEWELAAAAQPLDRMTLERIEITWR